MKMVTILDWTAEVGQLGWNPDPLAIETAQASCAGTAHIVWGGNDNGPLKNKLALDFPLEIILLIAVTSIKNGESGRGRSGCRGMHLQKFSAVASMEIFGACIAAAVAILHGGDGLGGSSQEGRWHPFAFPP